jgi:hypothetical protein
MATKKTTSGTSRSAQRANADKAMAAASARAAKITKAVHLAVAKAVPNAQVMSPNTGNLAQLLKGGGGQMPLDAKGPGPIEPKLSVYLVFVVSL